jgi:hypothetical protein
MNVLNVNVMQITQKESMLAIIPGSMSQEELEGTKGVIRIRQSMKETTQLPKEKGQKDKTIYEILHRKLKIKQHPTKNYDELRFSGRVGSSCSTSGSSHVTLVTRPMIGHEVGQNREVLTTSGTYNAISAIFQLYHGDLF